MFILDVETGERRQVTHLPPAPFAGILGTRVNVGFLNDRTIVFFTTTNPDGHDPDKSGLIFTVSIDGDEEPKSLSTVVVPGEVE